MLRIGFDGRALTSPAAGVRRYTLELFGAMAARGDVEVVAVGPEPGAVIPPGVQPAEAAASLPSNAGWMMSGLPRAASRARLHLFHAPSYTAPRGGPRPLVLTIHDVSYARRPEWYPYRRDPVRRAFYRWSANAADLIITDSEFSKREIIAAYRLPAERIEVVPLAAGPQFVAGPRLPPAMFVLHVGDIHPRRNLTVILHALAQLRKQSAEMRDVRLVLSGVDRGSLGDLQALAYKLSSGPPLLEMRGRTTDEELLHLYRTAIALVYPSKYEGFGLPLVEAMSCGTPVVAANAASIPEVTGDAALLRDPDDVEAWASGIAEMLDPAARARYRDASIARAAAFSWSRTADVTLRAYARVLPAQRS